ncbi:sigma 54-interacting transcriptional regulator [soil metagenome]
MSDRERPLILIADDDVKILQMLEAFLTSWGYETVRAMGKAELWKQCRGRKPDAVIIDLEFGSDNGIEITGELVKEHPDLAVILLTGFGSIDCAIDAIRRGAYDFLTKPLNSVRLRVTLEQALEKQKLRRRIDQLEQIVAPQSALQRLRGDSPAVSHLRQQIASIAPTDVTVMIQGESGTGKELVAQALHDLSPRSSKPFIPVNMAALPHDLVESTLFGHEKGAFTGADRIRIGCCEAADGGTLFLDEIGELDLDLQSKLLRFLQERQIQRVGSSTTRTVDVRILTATNRDLQQEVRRGRFREDLFYRLHVVPLDVPPLRDRAGDIELLAVHFLERSSARHGKPVRGFSAQALAILAAFRWPGNIRQLENLVERLVVLCPGSEVSAAELPAELTSQSQLSPPDSHDVSRPSGLCFVDVEKQTILEALRCADGNVRAAAKQLGLGQATVYRKLKVYGVATGRLLTEDSHVAIR